MTWIKENRFTATLAAITLVSAAGLFFWGYNGRSKYNQELEAYAEASARVSTLETSALYPTVENRDSKTKALNDYRVAVANLQDKFAPYRPTEAKPVTPQEFTAHLRSARSEVEAAFAKSHASFVDTSFLGFETYTGVLAKDKATGILDYQLKVTRDILLTLAQCSPTSLINIHRPKLQEELDQLAVISPDAVARALPMEITFKGREIAARKFLSELAMCKTYYTVVRSMRISNAKETPPVSGDAKFDNPVGPGAGATAKGKRILAQVLGNEDVVVFIRFDVLQFLPVKELPKVGF